MPPKADKYYCTSGNCRRQIKTSFDAALHPLLQVLVCNRCVNEYQTGDFSRFENGVDDNGDDNYCRWCVDGGDLFTCGNSEKEGPERCHYSFCKDCIAENCPNDRVLNNGDESDLDWKWTCYACKPSPILKLQRAARETILKLSQRDLQSRSAAVDKSTTSSTAENEPVTNKTTVIDVESEDRSTAEGNAAKRRKTDTTTPASQVKETPKETSKEKGRDKDRDRERFRDREEERDRERKDRDKNKDKEVVREPEACTLPPGIEIPRPPKTTLRNTKSFTTSIPKAQPGTPLISTSSKSQSSSVTKSHPSPTTIPKKPPSTPTPVATSATTTPKSQPAPKPQSTPRPQSTPKSQPAPTPASDTSTPKPQQPQSKPQQSAPVSASASSDAKSRLKSVIVVPNGRIDVATSRPAPNFSGPYALHKVGPAKQLKASNERITPSTRIRLNDKDLKDHLDNLGKIKDSCVKEIDIKFQSIFEMMTSKTLSSLGSENKMVVKRAIEDLEKPLQDFQTMLVKLKSLNSSQNQT